MADLVGEIEKSLLEPRRYAFFSGNYFAARVGEFRSLFRVTAYTQDGRQGHLFEGAHLLNVGALPSQVEAAERAFGHCLPDSYRKFMQRWNGGLLLLLEYYRLMPLDEVIRENYSIKNLTKESIPKQWSLIRFCDVGDGNYLAFCPFLNWRVIWADVENDDEANIATFSKKPEGESFEEWIVSLLRRDGQFRNKSCASPTYDYDANAIRLKPS